MAIFWSWPSLDDEVHGGVLCGFVRLLLVILMDAFPERSS